MLPPAELIGQSPLFAGLAPQLREQIAAHFTRHELPPNTEIVRQGDPADALFLIEAGLVAVLMRDQKLGIVRLVDQLTSPQSFGEAALITSGTRSATCMTLEPTVVHRLGRDVFDAAVQRLPAVALGIARTLAERLDRVQREGEVQWTSLSNRLPDRRLWASAPDALMRKHRFVPLEMDKYFLTVGMVDPQDGAALEAIRQSFSGVRFRVVAVSAEDFERFVALASHRSAAGKVGDAVMVPPEARPSITFVEEDEARNARAQQAIASSGSQLVAVVDDIVSTALAVGASDIHVEHERRQLLVRYRIDGALRPRAQSLPAEMGKPIVSRFKLLAKLDITETRRPQDGRISLHAGKRMVDLRVSTMPAKFGEKVVLRILDAEANVSDLKSLIVFDAVRQLFAEMVNRPHGLVLVTGPTGSGKTTTLYSALFSRRRPEANVVTVEDPIEYHLDGVTQVQVQAEITTFASILRALLRQDPNVIMVGETRDRETARMAVEASTTGHMVLTSMHTNSALEAVYRLLDLGVERYAIANSLVGVLHQRLVRRLCSGCAEPCDYPAPLVDRLYRVGAFYPQEKPTLRRGAGCQRCRGTGFKGRVAVAELLVASDAVRTAFSAGADLGQLRLVARNGALVELPRYAGVLLGMGVTVPGEVLHLLTEVGM
jgi:type II secretory ATPase GspE/PulE/Tfp pilus assembly ATPase PilB-like protein